MTSVVPKNPYPAVEAAITTHQFWGVRASRVNSAYFVVARRRKECPLAPPPQGGARLPMLTPQVPACLSRFTDVPCAVSGRGNNPITIRPIPKRNHGETGYKTRTAISAASLNARSQSCRKRGKP